MDGRSACSQHFLAYFIAAIIQISRNGPIVIKETMFDEQHMVLDDWELCTHSIFQTKKKMFSLHKLNHVDYLIFGIKYETIFEKLYKTKSMWVYGTLDLISVSYTDYSVRVTALRAKWRRKKAPINKFLQQNAR